jgi:hypothetical protein
LKEPCRIRSKSAHFPLRQEGSCIKNKSAGSPCIGTPNTTVLPSLKLVKYDHNRRLILPLNTTLRKSLGRHLDGVVRDLGLVLKSEEMALDFFQDRRIELDHATLPANLNRGVGNKQVFCAMTVRAC